MSFQYTLQQRANFYLNVLDKLIQQKIRNEFNNKRTLLWLYEKIDSIISELDRTVLDEDKYIVSYLVIYLVIKIYDIVQHFSYFITTYGYDYYIDNRLRKLQKYHKEFSTGLYIILEKDTTPIAEIVQNISSSKIEENALLVYIVHDMLDFMDKISMKLINDKPIKEQEKIKEETQKSYEVYPTSMINEQTNIKERLNYLEKYITILELTTKILASQNKFLLKSINDIRKTNIRNISETLDATFTFVLISSLIFSILLFYDMILYNIPIIVIIYSIIYIILIIYLWYVSNSSYKAVSKIKNIINNLEKDFIDNLKETISEKINKVK